ncbi:MAG: IMP dehydrogenase [Flavobacteriales bacterium]|nr:IMP dehydrogenase [Flavobacteriales bacterium]
MLDNNEKFIGEGLTYDDVLLVPSYSENLPHEVSLASKFTRNISINTPIISSAMDTVTEHELAISIAQQGGIGVIHKNMTVDRQANEVRKVKRSESGMILDPITLNEKALIGDALKLMAENKIGGIPVISKDRKLRGIVTNRDLRFEKELNKKIADVMTIKNLVTANEDVDLKKAENILQKHKIEKLPVIDKNDFLVGLITFKDIIKVKQHPNSCKDKFGRLRVAAAVGVSKDTFERIKALVKSSVDAIVIDTAHGHTKGVIDLLKKVKKEYSNLDVVVGNIATGEAAIDLVRAGADAIKVGIGPGSICTTRIIAGVGYPQLSAIMNVKKAIENSNVPIIADGGIRFTGDIPKAIAAGASSVMMGSMFAGTQESPGETIIYEGRKFKAYRGMGSIEAMQHGSKDRYFQEDENDIKKLVPEGISARVPFKGSLKEVVHQLIGGLRAGMGYCGSKNIDELMNAKFIKITNSGMIESHPHDVTITRESPNYNLR